MAFSGLPPMSADIHKEECIRILSLDGGDLSCISQLRILEELLKRLQYDSAMTKTIRSCEYFHSITGVGASGVIAILLGVLGFSIEAATIFFLRLCEETAIDKKMDPDVRSEKLVAAIKSLLSGIGVSEESRFQGEINWGDGCKVSIPYMAATDMTRCRMLRSYDSGHISHNLTILEALCISWADPGLFSPVLVGKDLMREELVSAVDGYNNPTLKAIEEAYNAFGKDQKVCLLLSLGAGEATVRSLSWDREDLGQMIARDTEASAEQLKRRYSGLRVYFRLSVDRYFDLGAALCLEQKAGVIGSCTSSYLETYDASNILDRCLKDSGHATMENLYRTRTSGSGSSRGLPPLSAFFVTRQKPLDQIAAALATRMPGSPAIGLVLGLSGTGKTQIALKYAYDHGDEYDHIIFVDASSEESLKKGLVTRIGLIDRHLHPTDAEEALDLLINPQGDLTRNWLLIMDNADSVALDIQDFIPSCDHGCVLITSRNAALSDLNPDGHIPMDVMSRGEAIEALLSAALGRKVPTSFMQSGVPRTTQNKHILYTKSDMECAGRIVDELGCLPLAVIQAACYIKKQKCLHEYLSLLKTSRNKILRWPASVQRNTLKYAHSTYAAFDTTLGALSSRAIKLLGVISFVNFSDFPKALISLAASLRFNYQPHILLDRSPEYQLSIDLLEEIFCTGGEWDPTELDSLLEELQNYSLVTLVPISTIVTLRFHPLLHRWANDRLSASDRKLFRAAAVRLLVCGTHYDDDYLWPYLFPHVELLPLTTDELHVNDRAALTIILDEPRHIDKALEIWSDIYARVDAVFGEKDVRTTLAALYLADAHGQNDNGRMEQMESRVLEIRREIYGEEHLETALAMAHLARTWKSMNKLSEAADLQLKVLAVRRKLVGPRHRLNVEALRELAETYVLQKKYTEAQNILDEAIDIITGLVGRPHVATVRAMEQQARCHTLGSNREKAIEVEQEIMSLWRTIRGERHAASLNAMSKLAMSYIEQAQNEKAEEIWRELLQWRRETLDSRHAHVLSALSWLARSIHNQGRYAEAEALWRELLDGNRITCGDEAEATFDAVDWLAKSLNSQGRFADEEELWREVVSKMEEALGEQDLRTLIAKFCHARAIFAQGRHAEAEVIFGEVAGARKKTLGEYHTDTLDAAFWYAYVVTQQQRHAEAEKLWRRVAEGNRIGYGGKHEFTVNAIYWMAQSIQYQGRPTDSEPLFRKVVAEMQEMSGMYHQRSLDALSWVGRAVFEQGRYEEAEEIWRKLVASNTTAYGEDDQFTLGSRYSLARTLHLQEKYAEADKVYGALVLRWRTNRDKDVNVVKSLYWMGRSALDQSRYAEAVKLLTEAVEAKTETVGAKHEDTVRARDWLSMAQRAAVVRGSPAALSTVSGDLPGKESTGASAAVIDSQDDSDAWIHIEGDSPGGE